VAGQVVSQGVLHQAVAPMGDRWVGGLGVSRAGHVAQKEERDPFFGVHGLLFLVCFYGKQR
jgi:hypothetical protein